MGFERFDCDYLVDAPYPPVRVREQNAAYAAEMLSNMGGCVSEMSAISLYFYSDLIAKEQDEAIASCFHDICIVEMEHLEIFGRLAIKLGADPRLWSHRGARKLYWSPAFVRYAADLKALVHHSIEAESAAIAKYTLQAERIKDESIAENLKRILLDEHRHLDIFQSMCMHL